MPGLPSVAASSQGWASVGSMWSTSLNEDWLPEWRVGSTGGFTVPCSPSSSGYIFTSTGDGTTGTGNGFYALGRAARVVQGASTIYGPVATALVAAGITTVGLSSSLATAALSTATAFTSVAVGTESGHSLAGSSGLGTTKFHREDGTWAVTAASLTSLTNSLAGDVTIVNANTYYDGPSVAQGVSGTWFASGTVTISNTDGAGGHWVTVKLWDGTTLIASTSRLLAANAKDGIALSGYLASPAGNIRISAASDAGASTLKILYQSASQVTPQEASASTLSVVKIA